MVVTERFPDLDAAVAACARRIVEGLGEALERSPRATFMVSGGQVPGKVLPRVARAGLDWSRLAVVSSDERFVAPDHPDSNEGTVRAALREAGGIAYHGIDVGLPLEEAARAHESTLRSLPWPPAVAYLGIGTDAHVASLFPDRPEIAGEAFVAGLPETAPHRHARITLGIPAIREAGRIVLVVNGPEKNAALDRALAPDADPLRTPITRLLREAAGEVHLLRCP
ncbi:MULTISPECIES: 6-phosphogluconolactonase [Methylobacterium]|uniref:6-phosphogluconolactonase n=2 Tax=Pseudomonadota TaxID=1224 RepID=A0ABQ4SVB5_9HYPH|nr:MULTISPECIES: 6-phosphogluconolactonase [Methylobacterium]PIU05843.1 MAG: 6-phosphogluconolactonase [Methylobacterium sp. CG09_land_8_20_14_0_10_71_15]PIU13252.1 MAG: 6-phosphogluconolactonase [Methylobacterium sp. CG08_land_8_20_14_0_20_71_15]GBU19094.1 6-phosphogluconolactonase [Methylobacterium sp.]GJE06445.1 6-phosphogluconolactonase [Methylobacterium jeotgali]